MNKLIRAIKNPKLFVFKAASLGWFNWMNDEDYLKMMFHLHMDRKLDLDNPKTFNEKLQWLKIHDRKPEYTTMVDKYAVKKYVADIIGEEYIIPTLGKWDHFDDIDFDQLPNQFVLKCNHDSGSIVIVKDKSKVDKAAARKKLERGLKRNLYWYAREWPYKDVKPCIIAEKYMEDSTTDGLRDYKFYNFNGETKFLYVSEGLENHSTARISFFDLQGKQMPFRRLDFKPFDGDCNLPSGFEKLKQVNAVLVKKLGAYFVRTDFYCIADKVLFSEITFSPGAGFTPFSPQDWDEKLGKLITLSNEIGGGYAVICNGFVLWLHEEKPKADGLTDYKFFCFDGQIKCLYVSSGSHTNEQKLQFYDRDFVPMDCKRTDYIDYEVLPSKPENYEKMVEFAERLSKGIPHVRVDLYDVKSQIYFGETTFYTGGGYIPFADAKWDRIFGDWIRI